MAKRGASSELNHDNWDRDEEPEESGTFAKASEEVIKKRTIKVAKRRNPISTQQNDDNKANIFGGFTAFSKSAPTSNNNNAFGFLTNLTKTSDDSEKQTNGTSNNELKPEEYYAKLKGLNESVSAWIKQHVSENPLINLQPVFKDYDRYYGELEKLKDTSTTITTPTPPSTITTTTTVATTIPQFSFGTASSSSSSSDKNNTTTATTLPKFSFAASSPAKFSFGGATPVTTPSAATFSFGSKPSSPLDSTVTASFSTSSGNTTNPPSSSSLSSSSDLTSKPSIFGNTTSFTNPITSSSLTDNKTNVDNDNVESDEPPKVDFTPVVEIDHIYTIRCKLFVKKDGNFGDRGVGTLYLKPIPNNEKLQLIVRADTNLGNLLCNFILSKSIPIKRMGKKDVMLVCLPTPEHKPPPVPILLRVKSPEEADELLNTLEKHKK